MRPLRIVSSVAMFLLVGCLVACGGIRNAAQKAKTTNDLKQIGLMYHNYWDQNKGKGPSGVADLQKFALSDPGAQAALAEVQAGKIVVIWDARIAEMTDGASKTVLGYESTVPAAGGPVLLGDASVMQMTAAEFNAAPKATASKKK